MGLYMLLGAKKVRFWRPCGLPNGSFFGPFLAKMRSKSVFEKACFLKALYPRRVGPPLGPKPGQAETESGD